MRRDRLCHKIIEENYSAILRFCRARLWNDDDGAQECTHEVFLLFLKKQSELNLDEGISKWLIAAASRIVKKYLREKAERMAMETDGVEEVPDQSSEPETRAPEFEILTDEEYSLLKRYYTTDRDAHRELAAELGISPNALYQRIFAIKSKIKHTK